MSRAVNKDGLTVKQEQFCREYQITGNASEAYRRSYSTANMKPETVNRRAKEVLDNGKVAARIKQLQAEVAKKYVCTIQSLAREFDEAANFAREVRQAGALVSALEKKGKLFGLFEKDNTQKQEVPKGEIHPSLLRMMNYRHDGSE
ncbi:MAG: terminase small subunit [Desulfobulbaceae bacterium]|nr:terminase small subunit [Desulfobulbaceae bacterium]